MGSRNEGKFNVAVAAIIEHVPTGKILVLKRSKDSHYMPDTWHYVTGRMKQFESPRDTLQREVKEETGLEIKIIKPLAAFHFFTHKKIPDDEVIGITFWCQAKSDMVKISEEASEYKWISPEKAIQLMPKDDMKDEIRAFMEERGLSQ